VEGDILAVQAKRVPRVLTVFNNKGGVGKTTLTYHMAHALAELGHKTLLIDLDPQCNLTIYSMSMESIASVWTVEDNYIEDFRAARSKSRVFDRIVSQPRSIHFSLKPTEDGTGDLDEIPPPVNITDNLDLIPGRLTLHMFEAKVGERWSGVYTGDPLAIQTASRIRSIAMSMAEKNGYEFVIMDTSPSLGALNRTILSSADAFIIPGAPDLFSVYGIRNIGKALEVWRKQFESIFHFLSPEKRASFPKTFVKFAGFTLYNARKLTGKKSTNVLGLAQAHYNYAKQIPETVFSSIGVNNMLDLDESVLRTSIGDNAVIWGHNTFPSMAQKYNLPMWKLPACGVLEKEDRSTIAGNQQIYLATQQMYHKFANDVVERLKGLND
jgi:cellulose biosynthesis protein BcsQ